MSGVKILVVDDEPSIREVVSLYLAQMGFDPTVVGDGQTALDLIRTDPPDLLILDVMLPGVDGFEFTRQVRATSAIPIILLAARKDGIGRIIGLELGADDYVVKPFSPRELVSRVKAVLRRTQQASTPPGGDQPVAVMSETSPARQILVVDDDPRMVRFVKMNLDLEGYQTLEASDGFHALEKIRKYEPDLVLLDGEMSGLDGFEMLKQLREISDIPAILLTVRSDEEGLIRGLELGANDYVTKPFSPRELSSRIRAVLRRTQLTVAPLGGDQPISVGSMRIAPRTNQVTVEEEEMALFPRRILRQLLADYGSTLLNEPERVNAFLADLCGEYHRERYLLVQAMRERVPADLLSQPQGVAALGPRLTRRLQERYGLSPEAAQWTIESWAFALNVEELPVSVSGLSAKDDVSTDRAVLVAFYHATNGSDWTNSENWLSDAPLETWYGVSTDSRGRVIGLSLSANQLGGTIPRELCNLSQLKTLDLSGRWFRGKNRLSGSIPVELAQLSRLRVLSLESNRLTGPIPPQLAQLSRLSVLSLGSNRLSGPIPPQLAQLSRLRELSLGCNELSGPIPPQLGNLSGLARLALQSNKLSGSIPPQLGSLSKLTMLTLSDNQLSGSIPPQLGNLSRLTGLVLSQNQLNGSVPPQLGNLINLTSLPLYSNSLNGSIPPHLSRLSNLKSLILRDNQLSGSIPPHLGSLSRLTYLDLSLNQLNGSIPPHLAQLSELKWLILSGNQLSGPIPPQLGNLSKLERLILSNNHLDGPIPIKIMYLPNLKGLDLDEGNKRIGKTSPRRAGHAHRSTPIERGAQNDRAVLIAFYYATNGANWMNNQNWLSSEPLNSWHGVVTDSNGRVEFLYLPNNELRCSIPADLGYLSNLTWLDLSNRLGSQGGTNKLKGPIPTTLASLSNLERLNLSNNQLSGPIPPQLASLGNLGVLDLSNNQLSGLIPSHLGILYKLTSLSLGNNKLSGSIPPQLGNLTNLTLMDLENNKLSGSIPPQLGNLTNLTLMDLRNNQLRGSIPHQLANLAYLKFLELSDNMLCGPIPLQLTSLIKEGYRPQEEDFPF